MKTTTDNKQKEIFSSEEADSWHARNSGYYESLGGSSDLLDWISKSNCIRSPENILEVGCSSGTT